MFALTILSRIPPALTSPGDPVRVCTFLALQKSWDKKFLVSALGSTFSKSSLRVSCRVRSSPTLDETGLPRWETCDGALPSLTHPAWWPTLRGHQACFLFQLSASDTSLL